MDEPRRSSRALADTDDSAHALFPAAGFIPNFDGHLIATQLFAEGGKGLWVDDLGGFVHQVSGDGLTCGSCGAEDHIALAAREAAEGDRVQGALLLVLGFVLVELVVALEEPLDHGSRLRTSGLACQVRSDDHGHGLCTLRACEVSAFTGGSSQVIGGAAPCTHNQAPLARECSEGAEADKRTGFALKFFLLENLLDGFGQGLVHAGGQCLWSVRGEKESDDVRCGVEIALAT